MSDLSFAEERPLDNNRFWTIDKNLLKAPDFSFETLAMSAPVVAKLKEALSDIVKVLLEKNEYVFSKVSDVFGYRLKLEQVQRSVVNSKVSWESLSNLDVLGFSLTSCQKTMSNMENLNVFIGQSLQLTPIDISGEMPNISDDNLASSIQELNVTVNASKVKFFDKTTRKDVLETVDNLVALDKSVEAMAGYAKRVVEDSKTYGTPIEGLAKNETVEVSNIYEVVDSVNKRITTVNHLLNAMFLLQTYNKVISVILTDAISNLKE